MANRVVFTPSGLAGEVDDGTTVLEAARRLGVDLDTVCGGRGICGRCQVVPSIGSFAKWGIEASAESLSPPGPIELDATPRRPLGTGHRLGCTAEIRGDVVVDVPAASQVHRQVVRKDLDLTTFEVDPLFTLWYLELPEIRLGDDRSLADLVEGEMVEQHGRRPPGIPLRSLEMLAPAMTRGSRAITIAIDERDDVVAVWPGFVGAACGAAIDIGSTTIAGHLCDLTTGDVVASAGRMNPQVRYGDDLMSRVSYVMMNPGGAGELTASVRIAVDDLIGELVDEAGTSREHVLEVVLVGNPIMHHVLLGLDPTPLGQAPFTLATNRAVRTRASDLDLALPYARCYVGPCIAGHVGADAAAVVLAAGPHRQEGARLVVDIGTNAEIVLGDRTALFAASSPTGPAFEGGQLSSGQRATAGAIERVRIDPISHEPRIKVIGVDAWSDEESFGDAIAATGVTGICGSGIIDAIAEMYLAGVVDANGVIDGAVAGRHVVPDGRTFAYVLWDGPDGRVSITQNDVRAVQLAKAALRAGIELLRERAGDPPIVGVSLAGAFGSHVDAQRAMVLGLVPDLPIGVVRSIGNAAGSGAVEALLSRSLREEMERVVRDITKIETATEPRFQELFVEAMAIPHASAPSVHLSQVVDLPAGTRSRPRRRRKVPSTATTEEVAP